LQKWRKALLQYLHNLWSVDSLSPHGICLLWRPDLIWTHVTADALIGISYFSIPIALAYFVSHRSDIAFGWVFWAFALFILGAAPRISSRSIRYGCRIMAPRRW
jgi:hypothetical protein